MRFLVHFALVFTVSLFVLRALAFPEIEQAAQFWSQIGAAVHDVGSDKHGHGRDLGGADPH